MYPDDDLRLIRPGSTNYNREMRISVMHMSHVKGNADVET